MSITYTTIVPNITASNASNSYTVSGQNGSFGYSTITGSGSSWLSSNTNFTSTNNKTIMSIPTGEEKMVLEKEATLEVKGNLVINGVNLEERLNTIEKVLQIPTRDVIMEAKHPKLKALYEQYMHELEKYKTWDRLNGNENGTT